MAAPERTERDITGLLNMAGHALSNRLAAALAEVELTPRMQCVLVHAMEQDRTQIELAALADLDKTTMVSTVDDLERHGLAERRPSPGDRRARIIAVTGKGRLAAEEGQRIVDRVHADALGDLSAADRAAFVEALGRLAGTIKDTGPQSVRRSRGR
ncbi:MarR family winged helix-turn-helix transcriptional regulator [Micromonosporaceae bacterium Da 78-11]